MVKTRGIDINSLRFSGKPVRFFDNSARGFDVTLVVALENGSEVRVSVPLNKDKKPYFTEQQFMACKSVSFIDAIFHSYMNNKTNQPAFQIKAGIRGVLLGVDIHLNNAFIGGVVSATNPETGRALVDIPYRKGLPEPGKKPEYGTRQVVVTVNNAGSMPKIGQEIVVSGTLAINSSGNVGVNAEQLSVV